LGRPLKILQSDALHEDGRGDNAGNECKENSWSAAVRPIAGGISSAHSAYLFQVEDYNKLNGPEATWNSDCDSKYTLYFTRDVANIVGGKPL
jgi:hypothetical protein